VEFLIKTFPSARPSIGLRACKNWRGCEHISIKFGNFIEIFSNPSALVKARREKILEADMNFCANLTA